jgi:hypothetical protein
MKSKFFRHINVLCIVLIVTVLSLNSAKATETNRLLKVEYAEFPFLIEYEVNGERFVIEDIFICEYEGIVNRGTGGSGIRWNTYFASSSPSIRNFYGTWQILLFENEECAVYCEIGGPGYYMERMQNNTAIPDSNYYGPTWRWLTPNIETAYPNIIVFTKDGSDILPLEFLEKYNFELICWVLSEPIDNEPLRYS